MATDKPVFPTGSAASPVTAGPPSAEASSGHVSVLSEAVIDALLPPLKALPLCVLDATYGRGGHARALLERLPPNARLYVIDRDPDALADARSLAAADHRVRVLAGCFADLDTLLAAEFGHAADRRVDALLLDLGVSSPQLDSAERGFSLRLAGPLDMRMDPASGQSAGDWLNSTTEGELIRVLRTYGEISYAPRLARAILAARPLQSTTELAEVVAAATPAAVRRRGGRTHEATRCFQAIRIFINDELGQLEQVLPKAFAALAPGGRMAVISFHSLEDRQVKRFFRACSQAPSMPRRLPIAADQLPQAPARLIGRAVRATDAELTANPRARSATLRTLERAA